MIYKLSATFYLFTNKKNTISVYTYIQHIVKHRFTYIQLHPLETMQYMYAD
jgi:hypothetical protein